MNRRRRRIRERANDRRRSREFRRRGWWTVRHTERIARRLLELYGDQSLEDFNAQYMLTPPPMTRADVEREFRRLPHFTPAPSADYERQYFENAVKRITE